MLSYQANILNPTTSISPISSIAFSPNNKKLAIATCERAILFYDENFELKDKIMARAADKEGRNFVIKSIEFSPDSTIISVAQTDNMIFSYRIGSSWGEKKSICSKIPTPCSSTCLVWPGSSLTELYFGQSDGQVRTGSTKTNKSQMLYQGSSYTTAISVDKQSQYLVSAHQDGQIYLYTMESQTFRKIFSTGTVLKSIVISKNIIYTGLDGVMGIIDRSGNTVQKVNVGIKEGMGELGCLWLNGSGDSLVIGAFSQLLLFSFNQRKNEWEEKGSIQPSNYYTITSGTWKPDGSKFVCGNLTGSVDIFDVSLKRLNLRGKFDLNYLSSSKVRVTSIETGVGSVIGSSKGYEIGSVEVLKDRFIVAHTHNSLILGDLLKNRVSEVDWQSSGNEKIEFSKGEAELCWIANAGEVSVIQLGQDMMLGAFRTEHTSNKTISVSSKGNNKMIAFLLDSQTVRVISLPSMISECTIEHDCKITWISFSPNGQRILFKDQRRSLFNFSLSTKEKSALLTNTSLCLWVEESDVIIAQSKNSIHVWYSAESSDKKTVIPTKGIFTGIKIHPKLSAIIQEKGQENYIQLDELLLRFGYAIENKDLSGCLRILEGRPVAESEGHWKTLLKLSEEEENYVLVEKCNIVLGDFAKASFYHIVNRKIRKLVKQGLSLKEALLNYEVKAMLLTLKKEFSKAEALYLENGVPDKAVEMYQEVHLWEESLRIVESTQKEAYSSQKASYIEWLLETNQEEKAAEIYEKDGALTQAIELLIKARLPVQAARLVITAHLSKDDEMTKRVFANLNSTEAFEAAGDLKLNFGEEDNALALYIKSGAFSKAVDLAKSVFPGSLSSIQEKWGDSLFEENHREKAIYHYLEAGNTKKALDAAIICHQWQRAISFLNALSPSDQKIYCKSIAKQLESTRQYDLAEKYFVKAEQIDLAFAMHLKAGRIKEALKFGKENWSPAEFAENCEIEAYEFEKRGDYVMAERLFIETGKSENAIKMYKEKGMYDHMLRLFVVYRPDNLKEAHRWIGKKMEEDELLQTAERHYLEANAWTSAVDMYEKRRMFKDCIRLCKNYASDRDTVERAKRWEVILGEDQLVELLKESSLVDSLIDFLCEKKKFAEAQKLAEVSRHKLPDIHLSIAMVLEDEGKLKEAEKEYIAARKIDQAVQMYLEVSDFLSALSLARSYSPNLLPTIYIKQGEQAILEKDFEKMEIAFINGKKPDFAVTSYAKFGKISEALRVARKHCPSMVQQISTLVDKTLNYDEITNEEIYQKGKLWEEAREYEKALDCYLEAQGDEQSLACWDKAIQLTYNYLPSRYLETVRIVCKRLREDNRFGLAGDYYESIQMFEEAAKCFGASEEFDKAYKCLEKISSQDIQNTIREQIQKIQREKLKVSGDTHKLIGNNQLEEAIEVMIERGEWTQALNTAKEKDVSYLVHVLESFLETFMNNGRFAECLKVLVCYGMPPSRNLIHLYKKLIDETFALCEESEIQDLCTALHLMLDDAQNRQQFPAELLKEFETFLLISHLNQMRNIYLKNNMKELNSAISISLVRFINLTNVDKPFLDAGQALREVGDDIQAFVFLNRYLDLFQAINDPETNPLESSEEFESSDIPPAEKLCLPKQNLISDNQMKEIRDWLLALSIKRGKELTLPRRKCEGCQQSIYLNSINCPHCDKNEQICHLTGLPILKKSSECCQKCLKVFDKGALGKYRNLFNHCPWCSSSFN